MPDIEDQYCIRIKCYGALGIEEKEGRVNIHMVEHREVKKWLDRTMDTLGPGDRAEITLTRGQQVPR